MGHAVRCSFNLVTLPVASGVVQGRGGTRPSQGNIFAVENSCRSDPVSLGRNLKTAKGSGSAARHAGRHDCNRAAPAGFAAGLVSLHLLFIFRSIFRWWPVPRADSNRSDSTILKLNAKLPVACAKLQRHGDNPSGWPVCKKSQGIRAVLPIRRENLGVRSPNSDCILNLKQCRSVWRVALVSVKHLRKPKALHPHDAKHQDDDGDDDV